MSRNVKLGLLALSGVVVVIIVLLAVFCGGPEELDKETRAVRDAVLGAVKQAKGGDRTQVDRIIRSLSKGEGTYASEKLWPDYASLLKEEDGQIQLLGAQGLYSVRSPKSKEAVSKYVASRDYRLSTGEGLTESEKESVDPQQLMWQMRAWSSAIRALGKVGGKSAIPLLESIRGKVDIQIEGGGRPVEDALAELGSVESLSDIRESADDREIGRAATAIGKIRDPNKVPDLMATARNVDTAVGIRKAALDALASINSPGVADFLVRMVNDAETDDSVRCSAAIAAGKTGATMVEEPLVSQVEDRKSNIRAHAIVGLVLLNPEKYMDLWFEETMDPNEQVDFRVKLTHLQMYIPGSIMGEHRGQLYGCLEASDLEGKPVDRIRVLTWCLINRLFGEQPTVTLTSRDSRVTGSIRSVMDLKMRRENHLMRFRERQEKMEELMETIVTVFSEEESKGE